VEEKRSVTIKRNGQGLFAKQGEFSEEKELLLCAVPEVTDWKECSDFLSEKWLEWSYWRHRNNNRNFVWAGKRQMYDCNEGDSFAVGYSRLFYWAVKNGRKKCPGGKVILS